MIFATRIPDHPAIGNIVAAGDPSARWMYVTEVTASTGDPQHLVYWAARWMYVTEVTASTGDPQHLVYWGRVWSARRQRWTISVRGCARAAVGRRIPRCPKPCAPQKETTA